MRVRVLSRYTQVVKQSNSVSLENPTTEGGLSLADLSAKIIKHDHIILYTQRVEQVKHCLCLVGSGLQEETRTRVWLAALPPLPTN